MLLVTKGLETVQPLPGVLWRKAEKKAPHKEKSVCCWVPQIYRQFRAFVEYTPDELSPCPPAIEDAELALTAAVTDNPRHSIQLLRIRV